VQADMMEEASCLNSPRRLMARNGVEIDEISKEIVNDNVRRIGRAIRGAKYLTKKYGIPVDWHEVLQKPLPTGMSIRMMGQGPDEAPPGEEPPAGRQKAATAAAAKGP
jgi:hypothetical protein